MFVKGQVRVTAELAKVDGKDDRVDVSNKSDRGVKAFAFLTFFLMFVKENDVLL